MVLYNFGTARDYGCLSTSTRRLERDMRRRGAFSLYWNSNAFALWARIKHLDFFPQDDMNECLEVNFPGRPAIRFFLFNFLNQNTLLGVRKHQTAVFSVYSVLGAFEQF